MVRLSRLPRDPVKSRGVTAALGIFDGVHKGHQAILRKAVRLAGKNGTPAAVTFYPHPLSVLRPSAAPPLLMTLDRRFEAFSRFGIRLALAVPFTKPFSRWPPERFVKELLVERLRVRQVVVGYNFRFGVGRRGSVKTLQQLGKRYGFGVHVIPQVRFGGVRISSGNLRNWIREGKLAPARRLMASPVAVTGRVVRGQGRGRELGFPTANVKPSVGVLPPVGVYAVRVRVGRHCYGGMANIGFRPTFSKTAGPPRLETHLFDTRKSLYGKEIEVEFVRRLRGEKRFYSPQLLAAQLRRDALRAKKVAAL